MEKVLTLSVDEERDGYGCGGIDWAFLSWARTCGRGGKGSLTLGLLWWIWPFR